MKNLFLLIFITGSTIIFSQNLKPKQKELEHAEMPSSYIDLNGEEVLGLISFNDYTPKYFKFRKNKDSEPIKIEASSVKSFKYNKSTVRVSFKKIFYSRVNKESKMQFFKYYHAKQYVNGDYYKQKGSNSMAGYYKFYLYMPGKIKLTYFHDKKLKRKFNKTVSKLVKDCPDLSQKIKKKVLGYKFIYSNWLNLNLWTKIAKEYENCSLEK